MLGTSLLLLLKDIFSKLFKFKPSDFLDTVSDEEDDCTTTGKSLLFMLSFKAVAILAFLLDLKDFPIGSLEVINNFLVRS